MDLFEPAGSLVVGEGSLQVESTRLGPSGLSAGIGVGFATDPVVRTDESGIVTPEVTTLVPVHVQASYTVSKDLRIDVSAPLYAWVDAPLTGFAGTALGDVRIGAALPIVSHPEDRIHFGIVPRIGLPTGSSTALVANGLRTTLLAALGGRVSDIGFALNGGASMMANEPLEDGAPGFGSTALASAGVWWHLSSVVRVGADADLSLGLVDAGAGRNNTGSVHGFGQVMHPSGLALTVGGGTGTLAGIGTPEMRLYSAISITPRDRDTDGDGLSDADDGCPDAAEDLDGYDDTDGCPDPDNDGDQVADDADACATEAEDLDGYDDTDGCPDPDNDEDGVVDVDDRCPDLPGPGAAEGCPDQDGDGTADPDDRCPVTAGLASLEGCTDRDGDGVPEPFDACPDEPKPADEDPARSDGCPKVVYVTAEEIRIEERVEFATGKTTIEAGSLVIIDAVRGILEAHPRVSLLEIQGHTDNVGPADFNRQLSQGRADAVKAYLVEAGIAPERLRSVGHGESSPMFSNRTPKGREGNRRVQFQILEDQPGEPVTP